jgi:hypothetical protein
LNQIWTLVRSLKWNHFHWLRVAGCVAWNWMCIVCDQRMCCCDHMKSHPYHFHLNDILVKWHIMQCAHVVVVLVHFAEKKNPILAKGFWKANKWFAKFGLHFVCVEAQNFAGWLWSHKQQQSEPRRLIDHLTEFSEENQDSIDKAQSELAPTSATIQDGWCVNKKHFFWGCVLVPQLTTGVLACTKFLTTWDFFWSIKVPNVCHMVPSCSHQVSNDYPLCSQFVPQVLTQEHRRRLHYIYFFGVPKVWYYFFLTSQSKKVNFNFGVPTTN